MKYTEERFHSLKQIAYKGEYELQRINALRKCFSLNVKKTKEKLEIYRNIYKTDSMVFHREDNSLPKEWYMCPFALFTSDVMPANELEDIKKGITHLYKKQKCNKFLGNSFDLKRIEDMRTYEPGASFWSNLGIIDFDNCEGLKDKVSHVYVKIRNLNDSYLMLDLEIIFTDEELAKIDGWMREDHQEEKMEYVKHFQSRGKDKTGGKYWVGKLYYDGSMTRLELLEKEYTQIKKQVFDQISKYLPLQLHERDIIQPSFVLYKSNLNRAEEIPMEFVDSMGMRRYLIRPEQVLTKDIHSFLYATERSGGANYYVVYMDQDVEQKEMYHSKETQLRYQFEEIYEAIGRKALAKYLYSDFRDECLKYRSKFKNISLSRRSLKKLYRLRNQYYNEMNFYKTVSDIEKYTIHPAKEADKLQVIAIDELKGANEWFSYIRNGKLTEYSNVIDKEIEDKILLCKDLSDRYQSNVSSWVALLSLVISFIALLVAMEVDVVEMVKEMVGR